MSGFQLPVPFSPDEFKARRAKVVAAMEPGCVALLQGAPPARGFRLFRQTNEFHYLSGVEVPQAYLLFGASGSSLYLPTLRLERVDAEALREAAGIDEVAPIESMNERIAGAKAIYTPHAPAEFEMGSRDEYLYSDKTLASDPWDEPLDRERKFIELLKHRFQHVPIQDLSPTLDALRAIKSPAELERCRKAGRLSAQVVTESMRITKPGVSEAEFHAVALQGYAAGGARGEGYRAIIASGPNMPEGHYIQNDRVMHDGEIVLMDTAPDYGYYTSDIGRIWPVSGTYAPWQRELYGFVVEYHKAVLRRLVLGATAEQVLKDASAEMAEVVAKTKFSKPAYEAAARKMLEFRGHLSHPVGMAVHDVGRYWDMPFQPGVVFTVDPQMWVPEEKLYIRVEDTIGFTEQGLEIFTAAAPLELDEVEATVRGA